MIRLSERCPIGPIKGLLVVTLPASVLLCAPASIAATPADTAATHALLQARYELDLAVLRNTPAAHASEAQRAASIGRECHGVLAGEPKEEDFLPSEGSLTPRANGERERSSRQQQTISEELGIVLSAASAAPDRSAFEAYGAATASLSWSDARIAPLVHAEAARLEEQVSAPPSDVCADMKAWAQSGYRQLSPASRALRAIQAARDEQREVEGSSSALLKQSEGATELVLLRRTAAVRRKLTSKLFQRFSVFSGLERALGVPEGPSEEHRQRLLARGKTRSGETFTVRRESPGESLDSSCRHPVSVEISKVQSQENGLNLISSDGSVCLSGRGERQPASGCSDGEVSVTVAVPGNVRSVRLGLNDGSSISSSVVHVPRRYGGPVGVYVQAFRAERHRPVSLTEFARHGEVVRTIRLSIPPCKRESRLAGLTFVNLVKGTVPGGRSFTIQGALIGPGKHRDLNVTAEVGSEGGGDEGPGETTIGGSGAKKAFPWSRIKGCPPSPFALLYSILEPPGDSVLARTPEGLVPLTKLTLAPNLGAAGPLVYGIFSSLPSELIVRRSDGTTLYSESLAATAEEDAEFCEGFVEP